MSLNARKVVALENDVTIRLPHSQQFHRGGRQLGRFRFRRPFRRLLFLFELLVETLLQHNYCSRKRDAGLCQTVMLVLTLK